MESPRVEPEPDSTMPRRLLLMVQELHRRGHERLRIMPCMSPSGLHWRLHVTPVSNILRSHGARMKRDEGASYSTGSGANCFGWTDAADDAPEALAAKFQERFAALCEEGRGRDEAYARWYSEMLRATEPDGLIYAFADWPSPKDGLAALRMPEGMRVPFPPPGEAAG